MVLVFVIVTKSINCNSFSFKLRLTNSTVNYVIVRTRIYAIGSLFIFLNSLAFGMTESINYAISISMITADTSMRCVTSISTCRIGYNRLVLVSESLTLSSVTSGACLGCRTSSINPIVLYAKAYVAFVATVIFICVMVTGSFNSFCSCCFTSFTSKCLNTCLFALRFCSDYTLIPSVTCSRNCFLSNENLVTNGAVLTFSKTCIYAIGSNCLVSYLGMTLRSYVDEGEVNKILLCFIIFSGIEGYVAVAASYFNIAVLGTACAVNYKITVSVTCSCNRFLCNENRVTNRAVLTFGQTCFGASRSLCSINYCGVALSAYVDEGEVNKILLCFIIFFGIEGNVAVTASDFNIAVLGTACAVNYKITVSVARSLNCFLSNKNFATNRAVLTFSQTCFGASSSNCLVSYLSMTKSRNCLLSNLIIAS